MNTGFGAASKHNICVTEGNEARSITNGMSASRAGGCYRMGGSLRIRIQIGVVFRGGNYAEAKKGRGYLESIFH